jgi:hypothetical protein
MATDPISGRRAAFAPRIALFALAFAATACASPPSERTAGHPATPAIAPGPARTHPVSPPAGQRVVLVNAGFESTQSASTGGPEGWYSYQHAGDTSYLFELDEAVPRGGARSLRIDNVGPEPYGSVAQDVPRSEFAGKTVRFSAWLKTRGVDSGGASLFIIADVTGSSFVYNFMPGAEVKGTHDWARYSLTLAAPALTNRVRVGATLEGKGTVWLDDAELEVLEGD